MFSDTFLGKISYLLIKNSLNSLKIKLDPRNRNGALFLGLNGIVVKSHGSADGFSYSNAIQTAYYESKNNLLDKIKEFTKKELND